MANFKTHLTIAATISSTLAIGLLITNLATSKAAFFYALLGTLGGILPDLDSPHSIPAQLFFTLSGILFASLLIISQLPQLSQVELLLLGGMTYFSVYYGLSKLVAKLTTHRGNFHSILAALWFGLATTACSYQLFEIRELVAWLAGAFITIGYLVHLLLDEVYSVDLTNRKLKKSYGSAFKLASLRYRISTMLLLLATVATFLFTPSTDKVVKILCNPHTYQQLKTQLWLP
jgi:hypothetical protein